MLSPLLTNEIWACPIFGVNGSDQVFREIKCGIVWSLAGGYRKKTGNVAPFLDTHMTTWREAYKSETMRLRIRHRARSSDQ